MTLFNKKLPVYSREVLPKGHCSRCVRLMADYFFGKKITREDSWNLRYYHKVLASGGIDLEDLDRRGILEPGQIIGMINPISEYINKRDLFGNLLDYTHVGLYVGKSELERNLVLHQWEGQVLLETEEELKSKGLKLFELLR